MFLTVEPDDVSKWDNHPTYKNAKKNNDVGLDIPMSSTFIVPPNARSHVINLGIKTEPSHGYMLVPRSSISKTTIRLANSIGIIDKEYRGYLMVKVDNLSDVDVILQEGSSYFQIVSFDGNLPKYNIGKVNKETSRGDNGFGSSGA